MHRTELLYIYIGFHVYALIINSTGATLKNLDISSSAIYHLSITLGANWDILEDKTCKIEDKYCQRGDKL